MPDHLLIIAEAGVNHNGSLERALEMVDVAAAAGADVIKFQTFSAERLARKDAQLAEYQKVANSGVTNQWELLKGLELSHEEFAAIRRRCEERGIEFLSTGFDLHEMDFLIDELGVARVKIASGDLTFAPLLFRAGLSGLPTILSTGMADLAEIGHALRFLAVGYGVHAGLLPAGSVPSPDVLSSAWADPAVRGLLDDAVTILHCTTEYPAPASALNLHAMQTIANEYGLAVGYSDHSLGALASTIAVSLGATVIEKHFTLDKELEGPDHAASLNPDELHSMVAALRTATIMLGSPEKECQPEEVTNKAAVRRSLVVSRDLAAGEILTASDLECQRPGAGRSSFEFWEVVGASVARDYRAGEYLD
ncbi:MAG: N-acetylneuraminate synthase [Pseudolysinimonas sp.]